MSSFLRVPTRKRPCTSTSPYMGTRFLDWKDLGADEIYKRITAKVTPGSIVLFHNAGKNTPEAQGRIIEDLIAQVGG